ncbi:hypothetical protein O9K51_00689 [Purpureocillium lavendulum]|uniref:SGNH hydrolase-type esterase domain-containing protein n=1 Tax=Purpureocillium lavendulum TaxID=1247861 RepID=A0AB34G465_9HYPO|nr:hypothetical protein O9K51_00689 [Purpureocillium lavendulum]
MSSDAPLTILCFGDDLTKGCHSNGVGESPYSEEMVQLLRRMLRGRDIRVHTSGVSCDMVSMPPFERRLQMESDQAYSSGDARKYDWVIMLAGRNDLASHHPPQNILSSLRKCWNIPLSQGSKVLALTLPECRFRDQYVEHDWAWLNTSILSHTQPDFYSMDLHQKIPYHSLCPRHTRMYWDHVGTATGLTEAGCEWMGGQIARGLIAILNKTMERPASKIPPLAESDNDAVFQEERGDPEKIEEGYVVVRKQDLN